MFACCADSSGNGEVVEKETTPPAVVAADEAKLPNAEEEAAKTREAEAERKAEEDAAKAKADEEAEQRKREEEAKAKEAEAKRKAEEDAAKAKADEEAEQKKREAESNQAAPAPATDLEGQKQSENSDLTLDMPYAVTPDAIAEYVDSGAAQKDRKMLLLKAVIGILVFICIGILGFKFLPELMETILRLGEELQKHKDNPGFFILCFVIQIVFSATPFPGRMAANLVMAFVYKWAALPILIFGQAIGGYIAFIGARLLWPKLEGKMDFIKSCCCCCSGRNGQPSKTVMFILASLAACEEKPFQTTFLLVLSPAPVTAISYILGAKCPNLNSVSYLAAVTLGGVKAIMPVYMASSADDIGSLVSDGADKDPIDMFVQLISLIIGACVFALISRRAYVQLKKTQEELKAKAQAANGGIIDAEGGVKSVEGRCSVLSTELVNSWQRHNGKAPPKEKKPRPGIIACSAFCIVLGIVLFVILLVTLVKFTPIYENMTLKMGPRLMCPEIEIKLPNLYIRSVKMSIPTTLINPNPIEVDASLVGDIYSSSGAWAGSLEKLSLHAAARPRSLGNAGSPTITEFRSNASMTNLALLGLPDTINIVQMIAQIQASMPPPAPAPAPSPPPAPAPAPAPVTPPAPAPGPSPPAPAPVPSPPAPAPGPAPGPCPSFTAGDIASSKLHIQCKLSKCEDVDLAKMSGRPVDCPFAKTMLGCDTDLSATQSSLPKGTLLKMLCSKTCSNCPGGRRLVEASRDRELEGRRLDDAIRSELARRLNSPLAVVIGTNLTGNSQITMLGSIKLERSMSSVRYIYREVKMDIYNTVADRIKDMIASGAIAGALGGAPPPVSCLLQDDDGGASVCAADKSLLFRPNVKPGDPGTDDCSSVGPKSEEFTKQEQRKWLFCILFMVIAVGCMCGGCFCCGKQALVATQKKQAKAVT